MVELVGQQYSVEIRGHSTCFGLAPGSIAVFDPELPPAGVGEWTAVWWASSNRRHVCMLNGMTPPASFEKDGRHVGVVSSVAGSKTFMQVPWDWVPHRLVRVIPPLNSD